MFGFRDESDTGPRRCSRNDSRTGIPARLLVGTGRNARPTACTLTLPFIVLALFATTASAADFEDGFDTAQSSWQIVIPNTTDARVRVQRRNRFIRRGGQASENIEIDAFRDGAIVRLEHTLPKSVPLDDLELSLNLRSSQAGSLVLLRLVFPQQVDPRTNQVLTAFLRGESYLDPGNWQTLRVDVTDANLSARIARLRAELKGQSLNLDNAYIDRVVIQPRLRRGTTEFFLDDLRWTGYVSPQRAIQQVGAETRTPQRHVEMLHDRLLIEGRPSIPVFAPYHGEPINRLRDIGLNVLWIDNYEDTERIQELRRNGLWAMATPPRDGGTAAGRDGRLRIRLSGADDGILFWYLGTRVPGSADEIVRNQTRIIRSADPVQRPVFADIAGNERSNSRTLDGVGLSRHPLHTQFTTLDYRRFLTQKTRQLLPGTFVTTWIQTEIEPDDGVLRSPLPVVEPEQIRLLTWTALAAGVRGIGYWKSTGFDSTFPGAHERELMIAIINQEIELLEPWLASQSVIEYRTVPASGIETMRRRTGRDEDEAVFGLGAIEQRRRAKELAAQKRNPTTTKIRSGSIELAMIHGPNGQLLMPVWHDPETQFVPGQMATRNLELLIPGIEDTATVWELSTTGVRTVPAVPTPSGRRVRLERFDQVAALVVSTDPNWGNILRSRINMIKVRSAALWLELAKAKLERVREVDRELQLLGFGQPDGLLLLERAAQFVEAAEGDYLRNVASRPDSGQPLRRGYPQSNLDVASIRWNSEAALQSLRILQRAHWREAIDGRGSPLASAYTACFQTLPEHWRLVRRIGTSPVASIENRLPAGDFEDVDSRQLVDDGWRNIQPELEDIRAAVEITRLPGDYNSILRMLSLSTSSEPPPVSLPAKPLALETPSMRVDAGQVVHISGRVRIPYPVRSSLEGVTLAENLTGSRLRWTKAGDWQTFEMIREVKRDSDLRLRLTLHGLGEVWFDDLKIVASDLAR